MNNQDFLQIAVRAYAIPSESKSRKPKYRRVKKPWPDLTLLFHCDTSSDITNRLTFGAYRVCQRVRLVDEALFYAEDLPKEMQEQLKEYCGTHTEGDMTSGPSLRLLSRSEFLKQIFFEVGYKARGVVVGFDLPFHLSRLAATWTKARVERYAEGFSFVMLKYKDKSGRERHNAFFPRIAIKAIDGKRALIGFTSAWQKGQGFRGHFLDARVLAFTLSGTYFDLEGACNAFGVPCVGSEQPNQGLSMSTSIGHVRHRVRNSGNSMNDSQAEYFRHPISLSPNYALSPASIGKAYLREMNIHIPKIHVEKGLGLTEEEILGLAMATYFGGRAECHIRKIVVPVTYCDFKSMYPTVNALMGLWDYLTAEWVYVEDATDEVMEYLERVWLDDMYNPETWRNLPALVEVKTDRDILPVRAHFSKSKKGSLTLGLNKVSSTLPLLFTLADVVASKLLVGKGTRIIRGIRFRPLGKQNKMNTIKVLGSIPVDPHHDDFFKVLVEARHRIKGEMAFDLAQQKRIEKSLKVIVNSTSYGIFIELLRRAREKTQVDVFGYEHFNCEVENPEIPGQFFFPILGTLLTSGARLMLATLEAELNRQGGTYAFMDTDSAAIVSSTEED